MRRYSASSAGVSVPSASAPPARDATIVKAAQNANVFRLLPERPALARTRVGVLQGERSHGQDFSRERRDRKALRSPAERRPHEAFVGTRGFLGGATPDAGDRHAHLEL